MAARRTRRLHHPFPLRIVLFIGIIVLLLARIPFLFWRILKDGK